MARPLRIEFPGALYHVTSRGNRQENIFESSEDANLFLSTLGEVCERYNWLCHAYCLMPNHYHLLTETPDANLSKGMRQLNGVYTQGFNRNYARVGHVFQGRYKAILVDSDSYLMELARYIVINPLRAGLVDSPEKWRWSSYRATAGYQPSPDFLQRDSLLAAFGERKEQAVESYKRFVDIADSQYSPWKFLKNQVYLGDDSFVDETRQLIDAEAELSEVPAAQKRSIPMPLAHYEAGADGRDDAIVKAYSSGGYSMKSIGEYFGLHYSRISRILKKAKNKT
jgi:REP element-mobilizing transposase RayT